MCVDCTAPTLNIPWHAKRGMHWQQLDPAIMTILKRHQPPELML